MITVNSVHSKIKDISERQVDPRPSVLVSVLTTELNTSRDHLLPYLAELKAMRVINFNENAKTSFKLTFLGLNSNI